MAKSPRPLPIIQSIPHAGLAVPEEVARCLQISETELYNEADLWADRHFDFTQYGQPLAVVTAQIARGLIDVNRSADDLTNPDGPIKSRTSYGRAIYAKPLDDALKFDLVERYYRPYHEQMAQAVRQHASSLRLLVDCHSMAQRGPTAYAYPNAVRPLIGLSNFGDERGEIRTGHSVVSCSPTLLRHSADIAYELFCDLPLVEPEPNVEVPVVAMNWPFRGGAIMRNYNSGVYDSSRPTRAPAIMIEVNRGLFIGNQNADTPIRPPDMERIRAVRERLLQWVVETLAVLENF